LHSLLTEYEEYILSWTYEIMNDLDSSATTHQHSPSDDFVQINRHLSSIASRSIYAVSLN
jgi:hypothetical protein